MALPAARTEVDAPVTCHAPPRPALAAADLGYSAFAERNRPRYTRYAEARLAADARAASVVGATLTYARRNWTWLLSQPSPAADVWEELRFQVRCGCEETVPRDADMAVLYDRLPEASVDSVVLCRHLGLRVGEAAELMGLEPPAVKAGLGIARRALPHLADGVPG